MLSLIRFPLLVVVLILLAPQTIIAGVPIQNTLTRIQGDGCQANQTKIQADIAEIPSSFIVNAGQVDANVRFMVKAGKHTIFFTPQEVVFAAGEQTEDELTRSSVVFLRFSGANEEARVNRGKPLPGAANFFLGDDPKKWRTNVPTYAAITYQHLYPGIDLVYSGKQGRLKSEFVVAAGADPTVITMAYSGTSAMYVRDDGALVLETPIGELVEAPPLIYQTIGERRVTVEGAYCLLGNGEVTFTLGEYVLTEPLIIDPELVYSTYLGGGGRDMGFGIAVDSSGCAYVTGGTGSIDFPTSQSPYQSDQGDYDAVVTKLSPSGSSLVYSTYLGGGDQDYGYSIAVDSSGNAYVTGWTMSSDFPTQNAYQSDQGNTDAFVAKLTPSGSSLVYSTYLGGGDVDRGYGIAVDNSGCAYVTGYTFSSDFPTQNAYQLDQESTDAFVTKLTPSGSSLVYSTYLGGGGVDSDYGQGIAVDSSGNAYVTGCTTSSDFPTQNAYQSHQADRDVFVTKLSPSGSSLVYSTYLGGGDDDCGRSIAADSSGNAYVIGYTDSSNFPTQNAYQASIGGRDVFVTKLSASGSSLVYSTYLGGGDYDVGYGIAVDSSGNAFVTGYTYSLDFPTQNAYQSSHQAGHHDAFVAKIREANGQVVNFPDPNLEQAIREAIDKPTGDIYQSDLLGLIELDANEQDITNLEGIQYCQDLKQIWLGANQIADIIEVSGLDKLTHLGLWGNRIADLSALSGLVNLYGLYIHSNEIIDISPLSSLGNLTQLNIANNQIADISPLFGLVNLSWLNISTNQIADISPLSWLSILETLYLDYNRISDIVPLSGLLNLQNLGLGHNQISNIASLARLTNLAYLGLGDNQISDIAVLSKSTHLRELFLDNNQISNISPLSWLSILETLSLDYNRISDIVPLSGLLNLQNLGLGHNQISNIAPLSGLVNLEALFLDGNQVSNIVFLSKLILLQLLFMENNQISDIAPLAGLTNLVQLYLDHNMLNDIQALVENSGLGVGDEVNVRYNYLDLAASADDMQNIQALINRGVDVEYQPQNTPENQPPDTRIVTANTDSGGGFAEFTWTGTDDTTPATELTYSYRLVRPGPTYDAWSSWSSGKTKKYTNLSPGSYKFQVRAKDTDGAIDPSPASKEFAIGETEKHPPIARASDISGQPQTMYPDTNYTITAKYFDLDGRDDLKICYLQLKHPEKRLTMMWYQEDGHKSTYAGEEGESYLSNLNVTSTEISDGNGNNGYELSWTFQISDQWPEVENAIDFGVFAMDDEDLESGWDYGSTHASFRTSRLVTLVSPLRITRRDLTPSFCSNTVGGSCFGDIPTLPYFIGDVLAATFAIQNTGNSPITLEALVVGGRFNGGTLPESEYPDFTARVLTLQPGQTYSYEGTLLLSHAGEYEFFCAYQIEGEPWITSIPLGAGLEDADRVQDVVVAYIASLYPTEASPTVDVAHLKPNERQWLYEQVKRVLDIDYAGARELAGHDHTLFDETLYEDAYIVLELLQKGTVHNMDLPADTQLTLQIMGEAAVPVIGVLVCGLALVFPPAILAAPLLFYVEPIVPKIAEFTQLISMEVFEEVALSDIGYVTAKLPGVGRIDVTWLRNPKDKIIVNMYLARPAKKGSIVIDVEGWHELDLHAQQMTGAWNAWMPLLGESYITDAEMMKNVQIITLHSPGELRVYDSQGRVTGLVDTQTHEGIPGSLYDDEIESVVLTSTTASYRYEVVGTGAGVYGLTITSIAEEGAFVFVATDMPIYRGAVHQFTIDWAGLERGEKGVRIEIDQDGDGVFERIVASDDELTGGDLDDPSLVVLDSVVVNGPNPVTTAGTAFFYALPEGTLTAKLMVFNALGRPIFETSLGVDSVRFPSAGTWNPVDQDDIPLANGPYVYVLIADGKVIGQEKMVIQR